MKYAGLALAASFLTLILWVGTDQQQRIHSLEFQLAVTQTGIGIQKDRTAIADQFYSEMRQDMSDLKERLK